MMLVPRRNFDLFDDIFDDSFFMPKNDNKMMRTDIEEKDNNYELAIDLPGMKKDNVKISLEDGYLTVHAKQESKNDEKDKHGKYIRRERYYGEASRSFYVGDEVTEEDIKAKFEDGFALVRASNTGPNITMRFEATTEERLKEIEDEFTTELHRCIEEIK